MLMRIRYVFERRPIVMVLAFIGAVLLSSSQAAADDKDKLAEPITKGQRVFTCGHRFHYWVPDILANLCKKAEIPDHKQIGVSSIGGSRVIQHWEVADDKNKAKEALKSGNVDVLTLSPIFLPDEGIENFTKLALEHNKDIRIVVQPIWLRWDIYEPTTKKPEKVDHNAMTGEELRKRHEPYFKSIDEHIQELNKKLGKTVLFEVPAPHAVIALRERIIAGKAPGLKAQEDLFTDELGHGTPPLQALVAYCNYAVIYRRSPVGLPVPEVLKRAKLGDQEEKLNRLLQELAWEAVVNHPLSGVRAEEKKKQTPKLDIPDSVTFETDVEYTYPGEESVKLDIAYPKSGDGPFPAVVCIHGGGFRAGSKQGYQKLALTMAQQGYVAVTIDYRLAPKHQFPAAVFDCKAAVRWLRANAKKYHVDPDRIGAMGGSAGGHLAQFLGVTRDVKEFEGDGGNLEQSSRVSCVVNYYGPSDFTKSYGKSKDAAEVLPLFLGGNLEKERKRHIQASPLYWVTPDAAPTLCIHGTKDEYVAHEQAEWIVDRLKAAEVEAELLTLEGAGHGFGGKDAETAEKAMLAFLQKHLKR